MCTILRIQESDIGVKKTDLSYSEGDCLLSELRT